MIFISVDTSQIRYSLEKLAEIGVKYHQKFGMVTKEFAISASNVPRTLINTWSPPNPDPTTLPGITRTSLNLSTLDLIWQQQLTLSSLNAALALHRKGLLLVSVKQGDRQVYPPQHA